MKKNFDLKSFMYARESKFLFTIFLKGSVGDNTFSSLKINMEREIQRKLANDKTISLEKS
jgi:hypothetical protein